MNDDREFEGFGKRVADERISQALSLPKELVSPHAKAGSAQKTWHLNLPG